jgi:hypothetical protein
LPPSIRFHSAVSGHTTGDLDIVAAIYSSTRLSPDPVAQFAVAATGLIAGVRLGIIEECGEVYPAASHSRHGPKSLTVIVCAVYGTVIPEQEFMSTTLCGPSVGSGFIGDRESIADPTGTATAGGGVRPDRG